MRLACVLLCALGLCGPCIAADNALSDKERAEGWKLLFDGKSLAGWKSTSTKPSWTVEGGAIAGMAKGSGNLVTEGRYGNFLLSVDFKEDTKCNSGIFLRVPEKPVTGCRGIECQIYQRQKKTDKHSCGSIYDAVAPAKNMCKGPGVWQNMLIDCRDNAIKVTLNGELVSQMNLDEWKTAGKARDGSRNKFTVAYKDMPRAGHIGFQNHGYKVWFRNIKIKPLEKGTNQEEPR